jgi:hypothetical protein
MHKASMLWIIATLTLGHPTAVHAKFISNAFGGEAENRTRGAAAQVFNGNQNFYAAMSKLEARSEESANVSFAASIESFSAARKQYENAAPLLRGKRFDISRLQPPQAALLLQFLQPFGASSDSDQGEIIGAYARSFNRTAEFLQANWKGINIERFRNIQTFLNRQLVVGTFISEVLQQQQ